MTDPMDPREIRRRREQAVFERENAERDEAQYLLDQLLSGARLITDDAGANHIAEQDAADGVFDPSVLPPSWASGTIGRRYADPDNPDPVDRNLAAEAMNPEDRRQVRSLERFRRPGSLLPDITSEATPGSDARMVLPETEDWFAFGGTPGAQELGAIQDERDVEAEQRRDEQHHTMVGQAQREWELGQRADAAREEAGRPAIERSGPLDPAERERRRAAAIDWFAQRDAQRAQQAQDVAGQALSASPVGPGITGALGGTFQGMTQGFGDEMLGLVDFLGGQNYEQSRDTYRAMFDGAQQAAPGAFGASRFAGGVGSGFMVPALGAGRATSFLGAMGRGAATGAGAGALAGAGESEASDSRGLLSDAGQSAAIGATLGGALGGAGHGVTRIARGLAESTPAFRREAARQRLAALGARKADIEAAERHFPGGVEALAEELRGMNLTSPTGTPQSFREAAEGALRSSGQRMGQVLDEARAAQRPPPVGALDATMPGTPGAYRSAATGPAQGTRIPIDQFLAEVHNDIVAPASRGTTNTSQAQAAAAQQWLERVAERYPDGIGVDDLQSLKRELQEAIFANRRDPGAGATAQAYNALQQNVRGRGDQMLDEIGGRISRPRLRQDFQAARRQNQAAHLADDWISDAASRGSANNVMQPMAEIHAAAGGGISGLATGVMRQILRNRQHSLAAEGLERAGRRFAGAPGAARTALGTATRIGAPTVAQGAALATADRAARPMAAAAPADLDAEIDSILAGDMPDELGGAPAQYDDDMNAEIDRILAGEQ